MILEIILIRENVYVLFHTMKISHKFVRGVLRVANNAQMVVIARLVKQIIILKNMYKKTCNFALKYAEMDISSKIQV